MKKITHTLIFLFFTSFIFAQLPVTETTFEPDVVFNNKGRILLFNNAEYAILVKEELHRNYYRMTLYRNGETFDCIWEKRSFISLTKY